MIKIVHVNGSGLRTSFPIFSDTFNFKLTLKDWKLWLDAKKVYNVHPTHKQHAKFIVKNNPENARFCTTGLFIELFFIHKLIKEYILKYGKLWTPTLTASRVKTNKTFDSLRNLPKLLDTLSNSLHSFTKMSKHQRNYQGKFFFCLPVLLASFIKASINSSLTWMSRFLNMNCSSVGVTMPSWSRSSKSNAVRKSAI